MTWNVEHNFPVLKDTYQVPINYPDAGYDTIIAAWFTDIFTSILAIQEALIGASSLLRLRSGPARKFELSENMTALDTVSILGDGRIEPVNGEIMGILQETGTTGQSKLVALPGGISSGHAGLTPDATYYLQPDGSLSTNVTDYPMARAISATELLLWGLSW